MKVILHLLVSSVYLTSGNYSDTLISINGCDSIVQTSLDVIPTHNYFTYTICSGDSVTVGTSTYNQTGNYIDTLLILWVVIVLYILKYLFMINIIPFLTVFLIIV